MRKHRNYGEFSKRIERNSKRLGMGSKRNPPQYPNSTHSFRGVMERLEKQADYVEEVRGFLIGMAERFEEHLYNLGDSPEVSSYIHRPSDTPKALYERLVTLDTMLSMIAPERAGLMQHIEENAEEIQELEEELEQREVTIKELQERLAQYEGSESYDTDDDEA